VEPLTVVPLVLHRVVGGRPEAFEDVRLSELEMILQTIGNDWVVFDGTGGARNAGKAWLLTFDDGYASDYELVFPRLQALGQRACFFLVPDWVGSPGHVSWTQVREMSRYGVEFGSHGLSHRKLTRLPPEQARKELALSREIIQDRLGKAVSAFSFPFGDYNRRLIGLAEEVGYTTCFTSDHGVCRWPARVVPRNSINRTMGPTEIKKVLAATMQTRCLWRLEDGAKRVLKRVLSDRGYERLRRVLSG